MLPSLTLRLDALQGLVVSLAIVGARRRAVTAPLSNMTREKYVVDLVHLIYNQ